MKIFMDTADVDEIVGMAELGIVYGVTTNPSLIAKSGRTQAEVIPEICKLVTGPVSAEVISTECAGMVREARQLAQIADNIVVKIPCIAEGLKAVRILSAEGIKTNVTLVFSLSQAILAANAGASYVSPFIGRLDDIGEDGVQRIDRAGAQVAIDHTQHRQRDARALAGALAPGLLLGALATQAVGAVGRTHFGGLTHRSDFMAATAASLAAMARAVKSARPSGHGSGTRSLGRGTGIAPFLIAGLAVSTPAPGAFSLKTAWWTARTPAAGPCAVRHAAAKPGLGKPPVSLGVLSWRGPTLPPRAFSHCSTRSHTMGLPALAASSATGAQPATL